MTSLYSSSTCLRVQPNILATLSLQGGVWSRSGFVIVRPQVGQIISPSSFRVALDSTASRTPFLKPLGRFVTSLAFLCSCPACGTAAATTPPPRTAACAAHAASSAWAMAGRAPAASSAWVAARSASSATSSEQPCYLRLSVPSMLPTPPRSPAVCTGNDAYCPAISARG